jgi:hypothetical protein
VSTFPVAEDVLDSSVDVLQLPDVAKLLGIPVTRVHQLLRDNQLIAIRRSRVAAVPALFLDEAERRILKPLPGLIHVLNDGGFTPTDILRWLFEEDDSLPGRPIDALCGHQAREVVRRAQALAF